MHEFHAVKDFVDHLLQSIPQGREVGTLCVRRGFTFSDECVKTAFEAQATGTPLQGAYLELLAPASELHCSCGYTTSAEDQDLGPLLVCPICDNLLELRPTPDLELVNLSFRHDAERDCA